MSLSSSSSSASSSSWIKKQEFFLIILISIFTVIFTIIVWRQIIPNNTTSSAYSFNLNTRGARVYTNYSHPPQQFPLKIIILNEYEHLQPVVEQCINAYNAISCLTGDDYDKNDHHRKGGGRGEKTASSSGGGGGGKRDYFQLVPIEPSDLQSDKAFDGTNATSLCRKYGAKLSIAVVTNKHVHGTFEENNDKEFDVLAHASMPRHGPMYICLDIENIQIFKKKWQFFKNIVAHEMGHILGLGEIYYDPINFPQNHPITKSIMSSLNLSSKLLYTGIRNEFDLESLAILYNKQKKIQHLVIY